MEGVELGAKMVREVRDLEKLVWYGCGQRHGERKDLNNLKDLNIILTLGSSL